MLIVLIYIYHKTCDIQTSWWCRKYDTDISSHEVYSSVNFSIRLYINEYVQYLQSILIFKYKTYIQYQLPCSTALNIYCQVPGTLKYSKIWILIAKFPKYCIVLNIDCAAPWASVMHNITVFSITCTLKYSTWYYTWEK